MASLNRQQLVEIYSTLAFVYQGLAKSRTRDAKYTRERVKAAAMAVEDCVGQMGPVPASAWGKESGA